MSAKTKKRINTLILILALGFAFPIWAQENSSQQPTAQQDQATIAKDSSASEDSAKADKTSEEKKAADEKKAKEEAEKAKAAESESEPDNHGADIDSEINVWGVHVNKDSSKAEEYGQVPQGFLLQWLRTYLDMKNGRYLDLKAANVGLNDGQYGFDYGVYGNYKLYIDYNKIPHLFSKDGVIIYNESAPGQWRLPDSVQQANQNLNNVPTTDPSYQTGLTNQRNFISSLIADAHPQSLDLQRNRGTTGFEYDFNTNWKANFEYFQENRDGFRPIGTALSFSNVIEFPEPIDYHTYRTGGGVEYANNGTVVSAGYQYLKFVNETQAMIWDSPYRFTDRADQTIGDGTSQGQLQLPADNHGNLFNVGGATHLGPGQISGSFVYSDWRDSVDLLPYTINSALPQVPLPASTFHGEFQNINLNLRYYAPVLTHGNLTVNYRLYDQKNKNDEFVFAAFSPLDSSVSTEEDTNPLNDYKTNTFDIDFNYPIASGFRAVAGYAFTKWDRTDREVTTTDINSFRFGVDALGTGKMSLHARYQYDHRNSNAFNLDNPTYDVIPLRRFDTANLNRNLFRVTGDYALTETATLGGTVSYVNNDYPDTEFGLLKAKYWTVGADFAYNPSENSNLDAWYEHAMNKSNQLGRQSGSTVSTSVNSNWSADLSDDYDTVGVDYQFNFQEDKMSWDTSLIYARANGFNDLTGGTDIRPTGAVDLPEADDTDHFSFKTQYSVKSFKHARIVVGYWFDKYTIKDFSEDSLKADLLVVTVQTPTGPSTSTPGVILLNARQGDYTYNSGWIGLIYSW